LGCAERVPGALYFRPVTGQPNMHNCLPNRWTSLVTEQTAQLACLLTQRSCRQFYTLWSPLRMQLLHAGAPSGRVACRGKESRGGRCRGRSKRHSSCHCGSGTESCCRCGKGCGACGRGGRQHYPYCNFAANTSCTIVLASTGAEPILLGGWLCDGLAATAHVSTAVGGRATIIYTCSGTRA